MSYRRSKRDRVLVVDDDASLAEMLTIVLQAEGLTTSVCRTGDEVMDVFTSFKPDVVLLDLMLPGQDGMKVCRRIRATRHHRGRLWRVPRAFRQVSRGTGRRRP